MQLQQINKETYRKHLNVLIIIGIVSLTVLSLGISQSAIFLFTDREGTHFWLNLMGVVLAMLIIGQVLKRYRSHPYLEEVDYVWRLKQQINYIYRKQKKVEALVDNGDINGFIIMSFYYKACQQLYRLDDNTITMSTVVKNANELEEKIESLKLNGTSETLAEQYQEALIKQV